MRSAMSQNSGRVIIHSEGNAREFGRAEQLLGMFGSTAQTLFFILDDVSCCCLIAAMI